VGGASLPLLLLKLFREVTLFLSELRPVARLSSIDPREPRDPRDDRRLCAKRDCMLSSLCWRDNEPS
jgi:hypothetical protein